VQLLFITGPPNGPVLFCWLASVVVCNAAGVRAGRPPGAWERCGRSGRAAVGRVDGRAADTARWASRVTSHHGDTLFKYQLQTLYTTIFEDCSFGHSRDMKEDSTRKIEVIWVVWDH